MKSKVKIAVFFTSGILISAFIVTVRATAGNGYPSSIQRALSELHSNVALGAGWSNFGQGSSVRARIHSVDVRSGEDTYVRIEEITGQDRGDIVTTYWDADHREDLGGMRYALDAPDLSETKATLVEDDQVPVGSKLYQAKVYNFEKSFNVLGETRTIRWRFWLAPGVPEGVVRRVTEDISTDPTYGDTDDTKLVDLDVPFVVGRKTLHCYCRESEDKYIGGKIERVRICYNSGVPGGIVKKDVHITESGKETLRQDYVLIDYHVEH